MDLALEIRNLAIRIPLLGDRARAVDDVSFSIPRNSITCVVGESGSGKSVTAQAVIGLLSKGLEVESGEILFNGRDVLQLDSSLRRQMRGQEISMIFQEPMSALNPLMTIGDQIAEVFNYHGQRGPQVREKALDLIRAVQLPNPEEIINAFPFRMSGGQRQRVVIAIALALRPKLLIADEPTTALDVTTQAQILQLIKDLQQEQGTSVLFITHDFGVVSEIADYVVVMRKGQVVESGPKADIMLRPQHDYTKLLLSAVPRFVQRDHELPQDSGSVLSVRDLCKNYLVRRGFFGRKRPFLAVHNVTLDLSSGETLGVVGESGSGKSSLGRCIIRLLDPDSGTIVLDGQDTSQLRRHSMRPVRQKIQMVFQDPYASLNPKHTVGQILRTVLSGVHMAEAAKEARCRELMGLVGLSEKALDRFPSEFSGGQRQRIAIARAIATHPKVLIADEAVSALDVSIQKQILELFKDLQDKLGLAILFITHDLRVAANICDRIMVMQKGQVVESGPTRDVFFHPQNPYTKSLLAAIPGMHTGFF